jgi:hypothetical protein
MSAFNGNQVTLGAAAKQIPIPAGSYNLALAAIGATVYVGGQTVSTTTGLPLVAGAQPIVFPVAAGSGGGLYAVGAGGTLAWMEAA